MRSENSLVVIRFGKTTTTALLELLGMLAPALPRRLRTFHPPPPAIIGPVAARFEGRYRN
jgi:hypothetical protein